MGFHHVAIATRDVDATHRFYSEAMGFELVKVEVGPAGESGFAKHLFYDTGNVAYRYQDFFEFEGFRHGVGVGVRYLLPIGPLRLDWTVNPDARGSEDDWVLHFALGLPF